ncbi:MAG: Spy/CpxP family protein refolding chaperone [Bacteroidales bacterium]|nr:Spy/CpxP family protein refolding chaperone [Bacteroidales bacterium]
MKTKLNLILISTLLLGIVSTGFAQRGQGKGMRMNNDQRGMKQHMMCQNIPDLTDEQESQIEALRIQHLKSTTALRNQYQEKKARIRTLTTGDNINLGKAKTIAGEIGDLKAKMLENRIEHQNKIRNVLTEKQKIYFDAHKRHSSMGNKYNKHHKRPGMRGDCMSKPQRPSRQLSE